MGGKVEVIDHCQTGGKLCVLQIVQRKRPTERGMVSMEPHSFKQFFSMLKSIFECESGVFPMPVTISGCV
jgi:hypothetical protein